MIYDPILTGKQRFTQQGYVLPTGTPLRIFEVLVVASGSNHSVYFTDNAPSSTATSTTTETLRVVAKDSTTSYFVGQYSNPIGLRFDNSALFHSCTSLHYAIVNYTTER